MPSAAAPSLFDLTAEAREWLAIAERAEDEADPRAMAEAEESLGLLLDVDLPRKVDGYGEVVSALRAQAGACKVEEDRLADRRRALEARADRMLLALGDAMRALGVRRIQGVLRTATLQAGTPAVEVADLDALPEEYRISKTTVTADKAALAKALKRGEAIPGASLRHGEHVRLR